MYILMDAVWMDLFNGSRYKDTFNFWDVHCTISDTIVSFELFFLGGSINEKQKDLENLNL